MERWEFGAAAFVSVFFTADYGAVSPERRLEGQAAAGGGLPLLTLHPLAIWFRLGPSSFRLFAGLEKGNSGERSMDVVMDS